jgi:protein-S-isoprenylcysteine O-methyltransferase Ste14
MAAGSSLPAEPPDRPGVLVAPPLLYGAGLIVGLLLEWATPLPGVPGSVTWPVGVALLVAGAALAAWFVSAFRRARTPVDVRRPTRSIVTDGPFRFSRNPGYLSLTIIYLGISVLADALWPIVVLPGVVLLVQRTVIEREERYLERKFGDDYLRYKLRTRRWL